jgi:hypothetical protein
MGVIAAAVSASTPLAGQSDRSGPDFSLLGNNNDQITVTCPPGVTGFDIKQDKGGSDPTAVKNVRNGLPIAGSALSAGNNYYIASPKGASESFYVILSQD